MTIFDVRKRTVGLLNKVSFLLTKVDPNWDMLLRYMHNHNKISISELFEHFYFWRTCRGLLWRSTLSNRGNYGWIFTKFSQNYLYTHWQLVLNYWVNRTTFRFSKTPYCMACSMTGRVWPGESSSWPTGLSPSWLPKSTLLSLRTQIGTGTLTWRGGRTLQWNSSGQIFSETMRETLPQCNLRTSISLTKSDLWYYPNCLECAKMSLLPKPELRSDPGIYFTT